MTEQVFNCSYCHRNKPAVDYYYHHDGQRYKTCIECREKARKWPSSQKKRKHVTSDGWKCDSSCKFWIECVKYRAPLKLPLPCFPNPSEVAERNLKLVPQEILEVLNERVSG